MAADLAVPTSTKNEAGKKPSGVASVEGCKAKLQRSFIEHPKAKVSKENLVTILIMVFFTASKNVKVGGPDEFVRWLQSTTYILIYAADRRLVPRKYPPKPVLWHKSW